MRNSMFVRRTTGLGDFPVARWLIRILIHPGWAPFAIVILHLALAYYGLTQKCDHLLHFLGGAAIAFFIYRLAAMLPPQVPTLPRWAHYALAFTSACSAALFWELAEFGLDQMQGTAIQQSLNETMLDIVFGVLGAMATLVLIASCRFLFRLVRRRTGQE